jgi:hypothetical protein
MGCQWLSRSEGAVRGKPPVAKRSAVATQVARLYSNADGKEQELWQEARAYGCVASLQVCVHSLELHRHSHRA